MTMGSLAPIREKLAKVVAMLSSDNDGDRRNAWRALNNILSGAGCTFVDLAALIENGKTEEAEGKYSEAEALQMYQSGFVDGQKSVEPQAPHQIDWPRIADAVAQHTDDLNSKEREFVTDVTRRIRVGRELTEKQANWLKDIYLKLGRRYGYTV